MSGSVDKKAADESLHLATKIDWVDPRKLRKRVINARHLKPREAVQLRENVERDGGLTSVILVCTLEDGSLEILSGHNRTETAIAAGVEMVPAMIITTPMSEARKTAIQLSHNAIVGEDDASVLVKMYESLNLDEKRYSGLTDDVLNLLPKMSIDGLGIGMPKSYEMVLMFLPDEIGAFQEKIEELNKLRATMSPHLVARSADIDRFLQTLVDVKIRDKIHNASMAINRMADLALERLAQLDAEDAAAKAPADGS